MICCILAGGKGMRMLGSGYACKPLIDIDYKPMIAHVMDIYRDWGIDDFVIALGYYADEIHDHFRLRPGVYGKGNIYFLNTGLDVTTGFRVKQCMDYLDQEEDICLTYADGLANVNIEKEIKQHQDYGHSATMTVVRPRSSFGVVVLDGTHIVEMLEKPLSAEWINGGFFVLNQSMKTSIDVDKPFEEGALPYLADEGRLWAFKHTGFWACVDTPKDLEYIRSVSEEKEKYPWRRYGNKQLLAG